MLSSCCSLVTLPSLSRISGRATSTRQSKSLVAGCVRVSAVKRNLHTHALSISSLSSWSTANDNTTNNSSALLHQWTSVRHRSNRSRRGLYDGKDIRSGNNVSFSMKSTKRKFKPNVFKKRLYSETLDEMIRFHLTTSALRSIDKAGGLDNYLLNSRHVTEGEGLKAKKRILKAIKDKTRMKDESEVEEQEQVEVTVVADQDETPAENDTTQEIAEVDKETKGEQEETGAQNRKDGN